MNAENKSVSRYRTVPVDFETHEKILALCEAYDMGRRAQGALIRRLVKAECRRLDADQLNNRLSATIQTQLRNK